MTTSREQLVSIDTTPYYHCVSRCVRRGYLCGKDAYTNQNYEHRRYWVEQKMLSLSEVYCIDICAYAIMSNHYHVVLHVDRDKALSLSHQEVVERWQMDHKIPTLIQRWLAQTIPSRAEEKRCLAIIESWRKRLWSLSWFMKELNYDIARKANQEDDCTGHFWESRFKSQALLDEKALLAAMAYVDLNPIRANIAQSIEASEFTSIKARLNAISNNLPSAPYLAPFIGGNSKLHQFGISFGLFDYIELLDWTARLSIAGKSSLSKHSPSILKNLAIEEHKWLVVCSNLERENATAVGSHYRVEEAKSQLKKSRINLYRLDS